MDLELRTLFRKYFTRLDPSDLHQLFVLAGRLNKVPETLSLVVQESRKRNNLDLIKEHLWDWKVSQNLIDVSLGLMPEPDFKSIPIAPAPSPGIKKYFFPNGFGIIIPNLDERDPVHLIELGIYEIKVRIFAYREKFPPASVIVTRYRVESFIPEYPLGSYQHDLRDTTQVPLVNFNHNILNIMKLVSKFDPE